MSNLNYKIEPAYCGDCVHFANVTQDGEGICAKDGTETWHGEIACKVAMECNRLADELCKMEEKLFQANIMLEDQSKSIAHLEGQVKAFEFCISKGMVGE